jgi:putative Holliday junction resolvase
MEKYLGLDLGQKTIGVAFSDDLGLTAQSLVTINRRGLKNDLEALAKIIEERVITGLVVGLPINMNGTMGEAARGVLKTVEVLQSTFKLPVYTFDERLSTVDAERILLEADLSRKKRKKVIDRLAAALILQGFLDQQKYQRKNGGETD